MSQGSPPASEHLWEGSTGTAVCLSLCGGCCTRHMSCFPSCPRCLWNTECPELAAAAGCRCGVGNIPLLCPALPHLLCTWSLAVLTQLGLPCVSWRLWTRGPWHGASLCRWHCTCGLWAEGAGHGAQLPGTRTWEPVLLSSVPLGPLSALWEETWINHITVAWRRGHKSFWRGKKPLLATAETWTSTCNLLEKINSMLGNLLTCLGIAHRQGELLTLQWHLPDVLPSIIIHLLQAGLLLPGHPGQAGWQPLKATDRFGRGGNILASWINSECSGLSVTNVAQKKEQRRTSELSSCSDTVRTPSFHPLLGKAESPAQVVFLQPTLITTWSVHTMVTAVRGVDVADHQLPWASRREKWPWQVGVCSQITGKHEKVRGAPQQLFSQSRLVPVHGVHSRPPACSRQALLPLAPDGLSHSQPTQPAHSQGPSHCSLEGQAESETSIFSRKTK